MAKGKTGDEIPHYEVLVTFKWFVLFSSPLAIFHTLKNVFHWSLRLLVMFAKNGFE